MRILLIFTLLIYVLYKMGLFRAFVSAGEAKPPRNPGNINVDTPPQKKQDFKGGEYVDYEEVK